MTYRLPTDSLLGGDMVVYRRSLTSKTCVMWDAPARMSARMPAGLTPRISAAVWTAVRGEGGGRPVLIQVKASTGNSTDGDPGRRLLDPLRAFCVAAVNWLILHANSDSGGLGIMTVTRRTSLVRSLESRWLRQC
jgi:hypothetical protein